MKKTMLALLMGSAALSLQADEMLSEAIMPPPPEPFYASHHELKPHFKVIRHKENNYKYPKLMGGVQYQYFKPEGPNFSAFMGYSHTDHKSYFEADWNLSYVFNYNYEMNFYPVIGFSNTSHFLSNSLGNDYQIYCSKFNGGVGANFTYDNLFTADLSIHYFKDLTNSVVLYKGNDFWGKHYRSPYGLKAALELTFPNIMSKDIVVGGFYAQTIKHAYKEFGLNTALVFSF